MSRILLSLLLVICFSAILCSQLDLRGKLTDPTTDTPIGFATVYLDGTSIGDVSADDGTFRIKIPAGRERATLIVSHLNYRTIAVTLTPQAQDLDLELRPKAAVLTKIEVADEDLRADNLKEFKRSLIGSDEWGRQTSILNNEVIRFERDARRVSVKISSKEMASRLRNRSYRNPEWSEDGKELTYDRPINLKAVTTSALRLNMPHLGYQLHLDLQYYESNYSKGRMSYLGTTYFIPDTLASLRQKRRFARARRDAYYGSGLHFIRSLLRDSLRENGFQVVEVLKESKPGRPPETRPITLTDYITDQGDGFYQLAGLEDKTVAILYYENQKVPGRTPSLDRKPSILQSRMVLVGPQSVLHYNGAQADINLLFSGDIGKRAMGWALPLDYWPEK